MKKTIFAIAVIVILIGLNIPTITATLPNENYEDNQETFIEFRHYYFAIAEIKGVISIHRVFNFFNDIFGNEYFISMRMKEGNITSAIFDDRDPVMIPGPDPDLTCTLCRFSAPFARWDVWEPDEDGEHIYVEGTVYLCRVYAEWNSHP